MSEMIRLDKYLADMKVGTRSEVKNYTRKGRVMVDGNVIKDPNTKIKTDAVVTFDNKSIGYEAYEYFMLNKPAGVVSATRDKLSETVVDLIIDGKNKDLFPVGRLDKDTEGLLLITNDGDLAHRLLSPKKHVSKVYYAKVSGFITDEDIQIFSKPMDLGDFTTLPANLNIEEAGEISTITVTIYEGKFHQIKRMFESIGKEVIYLKRLSMGDLKLDETLAPGDYRKLTEDELRRLKGNEEE
jgi:16S rRNA pseudouridine516 synthase